MKKKQESRMRMEALIPYMRLIGKKEMADLVQEYLEKNLTNDVNAAFFPLQFTCRREISRL